LPFLKRLIHDFEPYPGEILHERSECSTAETLDACGFRDEDMIMKGVHGKREPHEVQHLSVLLIAYDDPCDNLSLTINDATYAIHSVN
jgi:hypothetical protein